jgi:hypothetical protein
MGIPVMFPVMVITDNIGAIFMTENASSDIRSRNINTGHLLIREHFEDSFINIVFVETDDNNSDLFSKNINNDTYK